MNTDSVSSSQSIFRKYFAPDYRVTPFPEWISPLIARLCPDYGISLDIGCGSMPYRGAFRNLVIGMDNYHGIYEVKGDMSALPFQTGCGVFAVCLQAMFNRMDASSAAKEIFRVLQPDSCFIFSTYSFISGLIFRLRYGPVAHNIFPRKKWISIFSKAGFVLTDNTAGRRRHGKSAISRIIRLLPDPYMVMVFRKP